MRKQLYKTHLRSANRTSWLVLPYHPAFSSLAKIVSDIAAKWHTIAILGDRPSMSCIAPRISWSHGSRYLYQVLEPRKGGSVGHLLLFHYFHVETFQCSSSIIIIICYVIAPSLHAAILAMFKNNIENECPGAVRGMCRVRAHRTKLSSRCHFEAPG